MKEFLLPPPSLRQYISPFFPVLVKHAATSDRCGLFHAYYYRCTTSSVHVRAGGVPRALQMTWEALSQLPCSRRLPLRGGIAGSSILSTWSLVGDQLPARVGAHETAEQQNLKGPPKILDISSHILRFQQQYLKRSLRHTLATSQRLATPS